MGALPTGWCGQQVVVLVTQARALARTPPLRVLALVALLLATAVVDVVVQVHDTGGRWKWESRGRILDLAGCFAVSTVIVRMPLEAEVGALETEVRFCFLLSLGEERKRRHEMDYEKGADVTRATTGQGGRRAHPQKTPIPRRYQHATRFVDVRMDGPDHGTREEEALTLK